VLQEKAFKKPYVILQGENMNFKDRIKQKLIEDLMTPELQANLQHQAYGNSGLNPNMRRHNALQYQTLAQSPHLFKLNRETGKPERVEGVSLHPELHAALMSSIDEGGEPLTGEQRDMIRDFVQRHGQFTFMNKRYEEGQY
jgi:hypothetical protein